MTDIKDKLNEIERRFHSARLTDRFHLSADEAADWLAYTRELEARVAAPTPPQGSGAEPVAWQHRGKRWGQTEFGPWRDGRNQSFDTSEGDEHQERRLYAHPVSAQDVRAQALEEAAQALRAAKLALDQIDCTAWDGNRIPTLPAAYDEMKRIARNASMAIDRALANVQPEQETGR